jgi:hypothetical protein
VELQELAAAEAEMLAAMQVVQQEEMQEIIPAEVVVEVVVAPILPVRVDQE